MGIKNNIYCFKIKLYHLMCNRIRCELCLIQYKSTLTAVLLIQSCKQEVNIYLFSVPSGWCTSSSLVFLWPHNGHLSPRSWFSPGTSLLQPCQGWMMWQSAHPSCPLSSPAHVYNPSLLQRLLVSLLKKLFLFTDLPLSVHVRLGVTSFLLLSRGVRLAC